MAMFGDDFKIKRWHYDTINGERKRIIDEIKRKKNRGKQPLQRHPCAACGNSITITYVYCSVRCANMPR